MKRLLLVLALLLQWPVICLRASSELYLSDVSVTSQQSGEWSVYITHATEVTAFQLIADLPDGCSLTGAQLSDRAANSHVVSVSQRPDGRWFVGCWSTSNQTFSLDWGAVCTLTLTIDNRITSGTYPLADMETTLYFPDGGRISGKASPILYVESAASADVADIWARKQSPTLAYQITNCATGHILQCDGTSGKLTVVQPCEATDDNTFYLEPAFNQEEDRYYLRSRSGHYLSYLSEKTNQLMDASAANVSFALTETGKGEYGFCLSADAPGRWLRQSQLAGGTPVTAGTEDAQSHWQLKAVPSAWPVEYVKRLLQTASSCVGLTSGDSDLALRQIIHAIQCTIEGQTTLPDADETINRLAAAVKAARKSFREGDTSIAEVPWGEPERLPVGEYAVFMLDNGQRPHFLSSTGDSLLLSDSPSAFNHPIQDLFYNPVTDLYALRLSGETGTEEGIYLMGNATLDSLVTASRSLGESLRMWHIEPLTDAIDKYMTVDGKCGTYITWRFESETGTLFLSGNGRTSYYTSADKTPWYLYRGQIRHIVLAGDIKPLGSWLFAGCTALTRLTVTARTPATFESTTFDGVPSGLQIFAAYPSGYAQLLPGCETHPLATLQECYTYTGQPVTPVAVCDFPVTVQTQALMTSVGEYSITASFRVVVEGKTYAFSTACPYRILPAGIVATTRAYSRTYGAANPSFYLTLEGFVGQDSEASVVATRPTASCLAVTTSPVGEYEIAITGGELKNSNYTWDYRPSVLQVKEARLMVVANDTSRVQDEENPAFTFHCSGFVNGEDERVFTELPVLTTDADISSAPGVYTISVSDGYAPNYSLRYTSGTLTVTPDTPVLTIHAVNGEAVVYDLLGRPLGTMDSLQGRLHGLFIVDGRKIMLSEK